MNSSQKVCNEYVDKSNFIRHQALQEIYASTNLSPSNYGSPIQIDEEPMNEAQSFVRDPANFISNFDLNDSSVPEKYREKVQRLKDVLAGEGLLVDGGLDLGYQVPMRFQIAKVLYYIVTDNVKIMPPDARFDDNEPNLNGVQQIIGYALKNPNVLLYFGNGLKRMLRAEYSDKNHIPKELGVAGRRPQPKTS